MYDRRLGIPVSPSSRFYETTPDLVPENRSFRMHQGGRGRPEHRLRPACDAKTRSTKDETESRPRELHSVTSFGGCRGVRRSAAQVKEASNGD
jgi:hypothetical protein